MADPHYFVTQLIQEAVQSRASDIHLEPQRTHCRIRWRIDGTLHEKSTVPLWFSERILLHLKMCAELNIAEKRLPQDGRFRADTPASAIDIRVSTCPHWLGEKMVLRLLSQASTPLTLTACGLSGTALQNTLEALSAPHGLILVTGPTGSGKTTTLYAALQHLNTPDKNIITIEDPIEIECPGLTQVSIHPRIGFGFAEALRAFLRQDPDVILIGEIRDRETAEVAFQAAQTGHLVLASLHTHDAASAFSRLHALGLSTDKLTENLRLIIAQRLLRRVCTHCRAETPHCSHCLDGYHGRIGIFETLQPAIESAPAFTLRECAMQYQAQGLTTLSEINRVLGTRP